MKNPIIIILLVIAVVLSVGCGNSGIEGYYATQDPNNKESFVPYSALYNFKPDYVCEYFEPRVNSDDRGSKLVGSWEVKDNVLISTFKREIGIQLHKINLSNFSFIENSSFINVDLETGKELKIPTEVEKSSFFDGQIVFIKISEEAFLKNKPSNPLISNRFGLIEKTDLTRCRVCDDKVSVNAKACPHCGEPNPAK